VGFRGGSEKLANGESGVASFIVAGTFSRNGLNGSIGLYRAQVLAEHCPGHIKALVCEVLHLVKLWNKGAGKTTGKLKSLFCNNLRPLGIKYQLT
jgi:hypothetical protein